jgi:hypothetical protein
MIVRDDARLIARIAKIATIAGIEKFLIGNGDSGNAGNRRSFRSLPPGFTFVWTRTPASTPAV